ncbi:MAG TPA: tetratricopeptide repeat protein, partial [Phycisphaerae bacterium]|nr:tetratricopeptide repeat protein [Phycisphaerae bacterium]
DPDGADAIYRSGVEQFPKASPLLNNYALFLQTIRKDHDRAEEFYKRAIEADPQHTGILGNYAILLTQIRKKYGEAEAFYKRAIEIDSTHAGNLSNYAAMLLGLGRYDEGLALLDRAFNAFGAATGTDLQGECWFYAVAHRPSDRHPEALVQLKRLILQGQARSPYWDFTPNIERAVADGHPDAEWLPKLAAVINEKADPKTLDAWAAWAETEIAPTDE